VILGSLGLVKIDKSPEKAVFGALKDGVIQSCIEIEEVFSICISFPCGLDGFCDLCEGWEGSNVTALRIWESHTLRNQGLDHIVELQRLLVHPEELMVGWNCTSYATLSSVIFCEGHLRDVCR